MAINPTSKGADLVALVVSVVYRDLAIPVARRIKNGGQSGPWMPDLAALLDRQGPAVPSDMTVRVLGDRDLQSTRLWQAFRRQGWYPHMRYDRHITFQATTGSRGPAWHFVAHEGRYTVTAGRAFRRRKRHGTLIVLWIPSQEPPGACSRTNPTTTWTSAPTACGSGPNRVSARQAHGLAAVAAPCQSTLLARTGTNQHRTGGSGPNLAGSGLELPRRGAGTTHQVHQQSAKAVLLRFAVGQGGQQAHGTPLGTMRICDAYTMAGAAPQSASGSAASAGQNMGINPYLGQRIIYLKTVHTIARG